MLVFAAFFMLLTFTLLNHKSRRSITLKSIGEWILDCAGLICQGVVIPMLQVTVIVGLSHLFFPRLQGVWTVHPWIACGISLIGVDYLYYWNHRWLHTAPLWPIHHVHHTATQMDVLCTSRNTLWSSIFIVYLWIHGLFFYLLDDPSGYFVGVAITSALDLWRHSSLHIHQNCRLHRLLSFWLILPQDHGFHHSSEGFHTVFGANFKLWDRIHRTWKQPSKHDHRLGIATALPLWKQLFWPYPYNK